MEKGSSFINELKVIHDRTYCLLVFHSLSSDLLEHIELHSCLFIVYLHNVVDVSVCSNGIPDLHFHSAILFSI